MGLDCTHDAWSGAYSAFTRWRNFVAETAGYMVRPVKWDDTYTIDSILLHWGAVSAENIMGKWEKTPADPLLVLFCHSDCEGSIHPRDGKALADALEALLPKMTDEEGGGHIARNGGYRAVTERFINGLRLAASKRQVLGFH